MDNTTRNRIEHPPFEAVTQPDSQLAILGHDGHRQRSNSGTHSGKRGQLTLFDSVG